VVVVGSRLAICNSVSLVVIGSFPVATGWTLVAIGSCHIVTRSGSGAIVPWPDLL
jgi:hypothetical protein